MYFILKDHDSERYWYCDTGDSILLINKVRKKNMQIGGLAEKRKMLIFFVK